MLIRGARTEDLVGITEIYNEAIENTLAAWNETPVTVANRAAWLSEQRRLENPVLVAIRTNKNGDKVVAGFASYSQWRPWEAYRYTVENSVYVEAEHRGSGVGRRLMEALIIEAQKAGKHVMVAGIEAGNVQSIGLHRKLGFEQVGEFSQVGTKFGLWLDLVFLQRAL